MKITRALSTAFHPQTDGQTEAHNQTIERYLRCYINYRQDDWVALLSSAEFAYNNSEHSTTGKTPFFVVFHRHPKITEEIPAPHTARVPAAQERADSIVALRKDLISNYQQAQASQKKYYDRKHTPQHYKVGDKVMLSLRNIRTSRPCRKLEDKFRGPHTITDVVGKQAYRLELPSKMRIHPVFHVSLLEPYHQHSHGEDCPNNPDVMDGEEEWEVESILDFRNENSYPEYLVKWKYFPIQEASWQTETDLANAQEILKEFHNQIITTKQNLISKRKRGRPQRKNKNPRKS